MADHDIRRIMTDEEMSSEIMFEDLFTKVGMKRKDLALYGAKL